MQFTFIPQEIPEVLVVENERIGDTRGFFSEIYRDDQCRAHGIGPFVQDNLSRSVENVVRGLHFQKPPAAIGKLVRCARGRVLDVAVDVRRSSATFGKYVAVELNEDENRMLWVPQGFAHGFCVLSASADLHYRTTGYYSPPHDCGVRFDDPTVNIRWPVRAPILSPKDQKLPFLADAVDLF